VSTKIVTVYYRAISDSAIVYALPTKQVQGEAHLVSLSGPSIHVISRVMGPLFNGVFLEK
jgi:hypothetical protein